MKKILAILVVAAVVLGFVISRNNYLSKKSVENIEEKSVLQTTLPEGWSEVEDSNVVLKLEKKTDKGLKPQIVLIKSTSKDAANPAKYIDRLIAGTRSTVSGYKVISDKRNQEGEVYVSLLSGYYYNQKNKINLIQRVYIKGEEVNTLTASYNGDLTKEIDLILDTISKEKIGK